MKRDPYRSKERWETWKKNNKKLIQGIAPANSKLILDFLNDMEKGMNTPPRCKGPRHPTTLLNLRDHLLFFAKNLKNPFVKLTKIQIHNFDKKVRDGKIKKRNGKPFTAFGNYIKNFKTFWGWLVRTERVKENITIDLTKQTKKPSWVYLTETQFKQLANRCNPDYKTLTWFMYDAGLRVTEAYSIQVKNFDNDYSELTIPDEVAKTFGRVIKLKICTNLIKEFIKYHNLGPDDYLFIKKTAAFNKYLRELSKKLFGDGESKARETYDKFSLYDIRHNSSCYWLKRYQKDRNLMYRMGWNRQEMILYYSEFLGLSDEISDEDMVLSEDKNKLAKIEEKMKEQNNLFLKFVKGEIVYDTEQEIFYEGKKPINFSGIKV